MSATYEIDRLPESQSVIITLTGQIDRGASESLTTAYDAAATDGVTTIVLDFTSVDYINSTGIALIVSLLGRARAEKREVHAVGLTEHYRHVFDITRLSDFIKVYSENDAVTAPPNPKR